MIQPERLGKYLTLEQFCTCTQTYCKYADRIDPYPKNLEETFPALKALSQHTLDPVIDHFGKERFQLTYAFCSKDLKLKSDRLIERILAQRLPFDLLYYYGGDRPIHINYSLQQSCHRSINSHYQLDDPYAVITLDLEEGTTELAPHFHKATGLLSNDLFMRSEIALKVLPPIRDEKKRIPEEKALADLWLAMDEIRAKVIYVQPELELGDRQGTLFSFKVLQVFGLTAMLDLYQVFPNWER